MNIWIANQVFDFPETHIFAQLPALGFNVTAFYDPKMPDWKKKILEDGGIECIAFPFRSRMDFKATRLFKEELARRPCDLIYATINRPLATALRAVRGRPDIKVVGYRGTMGHISRFDPAAWMTYFNPRLDHIVAVSDAVKNFLVDDIGISKDKVTRIYKGQGIEWYENKELLLPLPEAKPGTVTISFSGLIRPVKGVEYLIDAVESLPKEMPVRLLLVGGITEKAMEERVKRLCETDSRFAWTGFRDDATVIAGKVDVLVMPTIDREGLSRAVIESMAQGVPAIVSSVGGLPEIVEDGISGLVVPPKDSKALAQAITKLVEDKEYRLRLGAAAKERIRTHFDYRKTGEEFAALFRRLVANR